MVGNSFCDNFGGQFFFYFLINNFVGVFKIFGVRAIGVIGFDLVGVDIGLDIVGVNVSDLNVQFFYFEVQ